MRGSKTHSNSLIFITEILKQHNLTEVTPKLSNEIGEWNEELKKDLDELSRKIGFDKNEFRQIFNEFNYRIFYKIKFFKNILLLLFIEKDFCFKNVLMSFMK